MRKNWGMTGFCGILDSMFFLFVITSYSIHYTKLYEEFLEGEEASFLAFTDGKTIIPLASAQDHKPVFDGDAGPNTGGMGAYSPAPVVTPAIHKQAMEEVLRRTVDGMAAEGRPYRGVSYNFV